MIVSKFSNIKRFWCISWWSYWNSKTWNKKKQEDRFLGVFLVHSAALLMQSVISSAEKCIRRRGVRRAGRGYMDENL